MFIPNRFRRQNLLNSVIIAYPRSGTTWLQMILSEYFLDMDIRSGVELKPNHRRTIKRTSGLAGVVRNKKVTIRRPDKWKNLNVIFLSRDPRDSILSNWEMSKNESSVKKFVGKKKGRVPLLSEWIRDDHFGVKCCVNWLNMWGEKHHKWHVVFYEDMVKDTPKVLKSIFDFLQAKVTIEKCEEYCNRWEIEKMRGVESQHKAAGLTLYGGMRSKRAVANSAEHGIVGRWKVKFSEEDKAYACNEVVRLKHPFDRYADDLE